MGTPLIFIMGSVTAMLPDDRRYAKNHMWLAAGDPATKGDASGGNRFRVGLSSYAAALIGAVRRLEWKVASATEVEAGQPIGSIEGSKATSDLYAPVAGVIARCNEELTKQPGLVTTSTYDDGWLLEMRCDEDALLSVAEYLTHLQAGWPTVSQMLRGLPAYPCDGQCGGGSEQPEATDDPNRQDGA